MAQIGYIRVSTVDQSTARQLADYSLDKTFTDKASAKTVERPQLKACLDYIREGDVLHVHSIDRLARDLRDLQDLIEQINRKGCSVKFHNENLTFSTNQSDAMSKLLLQVMGAFAEFERSLINERRLEGVAQARKRGVVFGAPKKLTDEDIEKMRADVEMGIPKSKIAERYNVSRATLYRALAA